MGKLKMTPKQAYGALYAIDRYLDSVDENILSTQGSGEYFRGVRAGVTEVIDAITKIIGNYQEK